MSVLQNGCRTREPDELELIYIPVCRKQPIHVNVQTEFHVTIFVEMKRFSLKRATQQILRKNLSFYQKT